jgi:class 3 adenylate cyclase
VASGGPADTRLDQAREALRGRRWTEARELIWAVRGERPLAPGDLELLAKVSYWSGDPEGSIAAREDAYAGYLEAGMQEGAAFCAITLAREHTARAEDAVAEGWLGRAERLLDRFVGSRPNGYLAIARADAARARSDFGQAFASLDQALEIADTTDDRNLRAWVLLRRGMFLVDEGRVDAGRPIVDEVADAAAAGELGMYTTGAVFSNATLMCRDLGEFRRGLEWAETAMRWCDRSSIAAFAGIFRLLRGELLRRLGRLSEANAEAGRAAEELAISGPVLVGAAQHELGEVRLRLGDLAGAEAAFRRASELGEDPQPGSAILRLEQGQTGAASESIRRSLDDGGSDRFGRARSLAAAAEIAASAEDVGAVEAAALELAEIAARIAAPAIRAQNEQAQGLRALLQGDHELASSHLERARAQWTEIGAPYEAASAGVALARAELARGDAGAAAAELELARATFERIGARRQAQRVAGLGAAGTPSPERVDRTFLFTDIVGSTSLIEAIGDDAWHDLRRWHDQALRSSFAQHRGEEIDHAGDGFFVAFLDVASAARCAIEVQRRLAEQRRTHGFAPQVRMGLHETSASHSGGDYSGLGVHTAARIAAQAGPGEILASEQTVRNVARIDTSDHRTISLAGLAEPVEVVSIAWRSSL